MIMMREVVIISMLVGIVGYSIGGIGGSVAALIGLMWFGLVAESIYNG
jgi:hypothetical protein